MLSMFKKKPLLDIDSERTIVETIQEAEGKTTGEIRVFIENRCKFVDPMDRAKEIFATLAMTNTECRNAVVIYVALKDRQFALFGDKAIYEKAGGPVFWQHAAAELKDHLKRNEITAGICRCINELGHALATHFPYDPRIQKNELPDEIVFGK